MGQQKTERIDIRASAQAKAILKQAAESMGQTVSDFILSVSLPAAREALIDRTLFALNDEQWAKFNQVLDRPAKENKKLKKLLNEPSVFD